jgi:thiamine kinase-like enzyme
MQTKARTPKSATDRVNALPIWSRRVEPVALAGGLSNESFVVEDRGRKFVVRFGCDFPFHHVFRERELMAARAANAAGLAPEIVHAGPGVMVSAFVEGRTLGAEGLRAAIPRIVPLIRRFHVEMPRHVSGPGSMFWVFHVIRDYARTLRDGGSRMAPRLDGFLELADGLERAQVALPIVFAHNDLLPANFIDDGERLWLIDFEYAGFSTAMFDLAGLASNARFSEEESDDLLSRYFGSPPSGELRRSHAAMQCASLLREAMWSMVSELHLDAPGVDYQTYTKANLTALDEAVERYRRLYGKDPS